MAAFAHDMRRVWVASFIYAALLVAYVVDCAPLWLIGVYLIMGIFAAFLYYLDKQAAIAGEWCIPENTLHLVDICGGIIGGLMAQQIFRHKTMKRSYRLTTWTIAGLHFGFLAVLATGYLSFWQPPPDVLLQR